MDTEFIFNLAHGVKAQLQAQDGNTDSPARLVLFVPHAPRAR